jgi:hypothetical protein
MSLPTKRKLKKHERLWEDWLENLPGPRTPGREFVISDRMTQLSNSIDLYQQIADIVFLAAVETVKRTKVPHTDDAGAKVSTAGERESPRMLFQ